MLVARLGSAALVAALPLFLVSAMAPELAQDIGFSSLAIGVCFFGYFASSAAGSSLAGRMVLRHGPRRSLRALFGISAVACGIVAVAPSGGFVIAACALAGLSNALLQPVVASTLMSFADARRRPVFVGAIMAGIPAAALATGLVAQTAVGATSIYLVFGIAAAGCILIGALAGGISLQTRQTEVAKPSMADDPPRGLWRIALAALLGSLAANTLPAYVVSTVGIYGLDSTAITLALPIAVAGCVAARLGAGLILGRAPRALPVLLSALLAVGAIGYLLMANPSSFYVGLFIAYSAGWGWVGAANAYPLTYAASRAPIVSGRLQAAVFTGSASGPLIFAVLASHSFELAWAVMSCVALAAATCAFPWSETKRARKRREPSGAPTLGGATLR